MQKLGKIMFFMMVAVVFTGCTRKDNPVGYDPVNQPKYIELGNEVIGNSYSYEDSVNNYINSSVITIGNLGKYETRTLIRCWGLPDSLYEIKDSVISLKLVVNNQYNSLENTYKIGKIRQYWEQNYVTYKSASDTTDWSDGFDEELITFSFSGEYSEKDSVIVILPGEFFYNQHDDIYKLDSLIINYGFYLRRAGADPESKDFIEYYSYESDSSIRPSISFDYKVEAAADEYTLWESGIIYDASIYNAITCDSDLEYYEVYDNELKLHNISPVKAFIEINISPVVFTELENSGIEDEEDFQSMTINKAFLVLHLKDDYYSSNNYFYTQPAVLTDTLLVNTPADNEIPVHQDNYELISGVVATQDSIYLSDEGNAMYKMEITRELQTLVTDKDGIKGFGLIIRSIRENRDFSYVNFYTKDEENPEKSPYLVIYYTPPLEQ
jgi:hypothetical protein